MEKIKNFKHKTQNVFLSALYDTSNEDEASIIKQATAILNAIGWEYSDEAPAVAQSTPKLTLASIRAKVAASAALNSQCNEEMDIPKRVIANPDSIMATLRSEL